MPRYIAATESLDPHGDRYGIPCYAIPAIDLPDFDPALVTALGRVAVLTELAKTGLDALLENIARTAGHPEDCWCWIRQATSWR